MALSILELRTLPDFSEQCEILDDDQPETDDRFSRIRPLVEWWQTLPDTPPPRTQLDPFSFGGAMVGYLVLLDVIGAGKDFKWRTFGGRHAQEFGADLTHVHLSELLADHPAAQGLSDVMNTVLERRKPVPFEIRYMSEKKLLRQAVGVLMPLADENGALSFIFGAADWVVAK